MSGVEAPSWSGRLKGAAMRARVLSVVGGLALAGVLSVPCALASEGAAPDASTPDVTASAGAASMAGKSVPGAGVSTSTSWSTATFARAEGVDGVPGSAAWDSADSPVGFASSDGSDAFDAAAAALTTDPAYRLIQGTGRTVSAAGASVAEDPALPGYSVSARWGVNMGAVRSVLAGESSLVPEGADADEPDLTTLTTQPDAYDLLMYDGALYSFASGPFYDEATMAQIWEAALAVTGDPVATVKRTGLYAEMADGDATLLPEVARVYELPSLTPKHIGYPMLLVRVGDACAIYEAIDTKESSVSGPQMSKLILEDIARLATLAS